MADMTSTCVIRGCVVGLLILPGSFLSAQDTAIQSTQEVIVETPTDVDSATPGTSEQASDVDAQADADLPAADDLTSVATPAGKIDLRTADESVRSRYRNINGEWWYQMKSGRWVYWRDGKWQDFDPAEYTPPAGSVPQDFVPGSTINQWNSMPPIQNVVPQTSGNSLVPYSVVPRTYGDEMDQYRNFSPSRSVYGPGVPYGAYRPLYNSPAELRRFGGIEYGTRSYGIGGVRPFGGLPSYGGLSSGSYHGGGIGVSPGRGIGSGSIGNRRGDQ